MSRIKKLFSNARGATAIEYGIIAALVAVAAVAGFEAVGTGLNTSLSSAAAEL